MVPRKVTAKMPDRMLLVSYEFPPIGGTQSQSIAKLAEGLARRGWTVEALMVADPAVHMIDEELRRELPDNVHVRQAYSLEPTRVAQWFRRLRHGRGRGETVSGGRTGAGEARYDRTYTRLPRWFVQAVRVFFVPDEKFGWTPWAVREAERIHAEEPFDIVISAGPPYSAYGIGWRVARRLRLPCVAVLMDLIVGCDGIKPPTPMNAMLMRAYERRVIERADLVVIASDWMRAEVLERIPEASDRIVAMNNAFDPRDFQGDEPSPHDDFVVSFVGMFTPARRPDVFLDAVARLLEGNEALRRDLRVRFVGPRSAATDRAISSRGLGDTVEQSGFVSHPEAIGAMRASDVLLLVLGPEPESRTLVTSKLPEYLAAGKAVLALVPDGAAAEIVRRADAGDVVDPTDSTAVAEALSRLYEAWRGGTLPVPKREVVEEFNREKQLDVLDEMLGRLKKSEGDAKADSTATEDGNQAARGMRGGDVSADR